MRTHMLMYTHNGGGRSNTHTHRHTHRHSMMEEGQAYWGADV